MRPPLDGASILITGASAGLGVEFARQLAGRARRLILVARRRDRLEELAATLRAAHPSLEVEVMPCDLSDLAATRALADAAAGLPGGVDILINNAGFGDSGLFVDRDEAKLVEMLRVNIEAPLVLSKRLLPAMAARGAGGILNVSSGVGLLWLPGMATYAATKHFVTAWSEALRVEARGRGVVVSQLNPGPVATEFEDVAAHPQGIRVPALINMRPEVCVRRGLAGFAAGRALIVPGLGLAVAFALAGWTPRWLRRLVLRVVVPRFAAR